MSLQIEQLAKLFPKQSGELLDCLLAAMTAGDLVDDLHVAARFASQIGHESIGLTHFREIGGEHKSYAPWFGRGAIQLTHQYNYEACAHGTGLDCVNHPELLEEPDGAFRSAVWYYVSHGLDKLSNLDAISTKINGNGITQSSLQSRRDWYVRACQAFGI